MFLPSDGSLGAALNFWPLPLGNDRPRQPAHIEREVVHAAEEDVGGHSIALQCPEEMHRLSFNDGDVADEVECGVIAGAQPAFLSLAAFEFDDVSITPCQVRRVASGSPTAR